MMTALMAGILIGLAARDLWPITRRRLQRELPPPPPPSPVRPRRQQRRIGP